MRLSNVTADIEALERRVIAACLARDNALIDLVIGSVFPEDFTDPYRRILFDTTLDIILDKDGIPTKYKLSEAIKGHENTKLLQQELSRIEVLTGSYFTARSVELDCNQFRDLSKRHRLFAIGRDIADGARDNSGKTTTELTNELYGRMLGLLMADGAGQLLDGNQAVDKVEAIQTEYVEKKYYERLRTGFYNIDQNMQILPGKLIVIGGYTSTGKSALALNFTNNMLQSDIPVLYISIEMDCVDIVYRLAAMNGDTDLMTFVRGNVTGLRNNTGLQKLAPFLEHFHLADLSEASEVKISLLMQQHMLRHPDTGAVVIDYLQNVDCERRARESRHLQISSMAKYFRTAAKKLNVPVFLVSQLKRPENQTTKFKLAQTGDLKESGDIENTADMIILINKIGGEYKANWYGILGIGKQRQGIRRLIGVKFTGSQTRFQECHIPDDVLKTVRLNPEAIQ